MQKLNKKLYLPTLLLSLVWLHVYAGTQATAANPPENLPFRISGWSEVVLSVTDLDRQRQFLEDVAGWLPLYEGPVDPATLAAWHLESCVTADQLLMSNPGTKRGYIRLVQFHNVKQEQIRSNAQPWESGGIFDIDVRVRDMDSNFLEIQRYGWHAYGDPVQYAFGPFEVKEWVTIGPDGLSLALIERIRPELEGWTQLRDISRAFNSTQVVSDMPAALHFYRDVLGFRKYLNWRGTSKTAGPNVLGLPDQLTTTIEREVWILSPDGSNEGSVELLQFHGLSGRDLAAHAMAPNIGMLMLRFPVVNLDKLIQHLRGQAINLQGPVTTTGLKPGGAARQVSVRSPDGTWLDFYEPEK